MSRNIFNRYKANICKLITAYPLLFDKQDPKPLAIGIFDQIVVEGSSGLSKTQIRDCLAIWCRRIEYFKATRKANAMRHNLNGTEAEPVSPEHAARAARVHDAKHHKLKKERVKSKALQVENDHPDF